MKLNSVFGWLVLAGGLVACDGTTRRSSAYPEGGVNGGQDGSGGESPSPPGCIEGRVEAELSAPSSMPHRPFWVDSAGFHVAYVDRYLGIARTTLSSETGQEIATETDQVFPADLDPGYWGLDAVATSPQGDLAFAFGYMDTGVRHEGILSVTSGSKQAWTPPWNSPYGAWGLGWDGEGFTASLLNWDATWAAARFSPQGEMLGGVEVFGQGSVNYGYYDSETDSQSGTTVFAGASTPGVAVVGRRGRESSLTAPSSFWQVSSDQRTSGWATALALNGNTALIAWVESGIVVREISLDTGEVLQAWSVSKDPGDNVFQRVAAARAGDRWVIVGQDYRGLVLAEIRNNVIGQRRLLRHTPAACAETDTCGPLLTSDWRWDGRKVSLAVDGDSAWLGVLDMSTQRVDGIRALFTYRILPLREGCEYESLASR